MPEIAALPVRFVLVGIVNSAAGLGAIYACKLGVGLNNVTANVIGYGFGLAVSFVLNASWTFRYQGAVYPAILRFVLVFLVSYGTNLVIVMVLIEYFQINSYAAQAIGILPYTFTFYVLSRTVVFRS